MKVKSIMIVDDDSTSNFVTCEVIKKINYTENIIIKNTGRQALDYIKNSCLPNGEFPDLIFVDLKMPEMDGFEFLDKFEMLCEEARYKIAVVILTGSRRADDIVKLRERGRYYLLNKPLTVEMLEDIHHRFFRGKLAF
jgi:CheY-like chemotaxis protein